MAAFFPDNQSSLRTRVKASGKCGSEGRTLNGIQGIRTCFEIAWRPAARDFACGQNPSAQSRLTRMGANAPSLLERGSVTRSRCASQNSFGRAAAHRAALLSFFLPLFVSFVCFWSNLFFPLLRLPKMRLIQQHWGRGEGAVFPGLPAGESIQPPSGAIGDGQVVRETPGFSHADMVSLQWFQAGIKSLF